MLPASQELPIGLLDVAGMASPTMFASLLGDPFSPITAMAGEEELLEKYRAGEIASVFPQPHRLGGPQFGRYLEMPSKRDITNEMYAGAYIDTSKGKPKLRVAQVMEPEDIRALPGTHIFTNLYKNPPFLIRPDGYPEDGRFVISNEFRGGERVNPMFRKSGDHLYSLETHFDTPVMLGRDEGKIRSHLRAMEKGTRPPGEPFMRPRATGKMELGNVVGELKLKGKAKPIFDQIMMYLPKNYVRGF
jgi:hypothetical protein